MEDSEFNAPLKRNRGFGNTRRWLVAFMLVLVVFLVVYDFSGLKGWMGKYLPFGQKNGEGGSIFEKVIPSKHTASSQKKDIVVTDKDLHKVYLDVLAGNKKEIEKTTVLETEKDSLYLIELVTGRSLLATNVQFDMKMVTITDDQGVVISMGRDEIAGIKKIQKKESK
jgi:hypothetical protein